MSDVPDPMAAVELFNDDQSGFEPDPTPQDDGVPDEYKGKTKAEILAELNEARQQADLTRSLSESLSSLGQPPTVAPEPTPQPPPAAQEAPSLDLTNDNFFDDTLGNLDKHFQYKMAPLMREFAERDLRKDGALLQLNPEHGKFAQKHWSEIQSYVNKLSPQERYAGNAYDRALQAIQSSHPDELQAQAISSTISKNPDQVIEALKAAGYDVKPAGKSDDRPTLPATGTSYVAGEGGPPPDPAGSKRRYRVSVEDDRQARLLGMPLDDYVAKKTGVPKNQMELVTR